MAVKGFVYRGESRTVEDVKRASTISTGNYDSITVDGLPYFKPKSGENVIRIMPPTWEDVKKWGKDWAIIISVHNNIGPDRGSFLCLDAMRGEPCPICEERRRTNDEEERFQLSPNKRALVWIIDRNDEGAGPMLWSMPIKKVFRQINARSVDRKSGALVLVDHPEKGYDVIFDVENAGKKNADYTGVEIDRDASFMATKEEDQDRWMKFIMDNPLPEVLSWPDPAYIEKVLTGKVSRREDADEEATEGEAAPRSRRRGAEAAEPERSSRRGRDDPPEENEGDETPRRTVRTARGRGNGEPPEEDETPPEEADAEGEATPPRTSRRGRGDPEEEGTRAEPERSSRRGRGDPEEDAPRRTARSREPEADPAPSRQARGALERLRPTGRQAETTRSRSE